MGFVMNTIPEFVGSVAEKLKLIPAKDSTRVMKFPYTTTAQIGLFPYRFYWKNQWLTRYWIYGIIITFPIINAIDKLSNTPENKKKWKEIRAKQFEGHH
ncbi:unnamed protein product [Allacma fusca]|uniref:Uncharacterized protein n=1 Tax=Allacma fusca TaxID=39272 RepID=A0A8J2L9C6_9HEXA|nr:unnamed protein product [Allacma fusca]